MEPVVAISEGGMFLMQHPNGTTICADNHGGEIQVNIIRMSQEPLKLPPFRAAENLTPDALVAVRCKRFAAE